jgi:hypothetical protein
MNAETRTIQLLKKAEDDQKAGHSIIVMASSKTDLLHTLSNGLWAFSQAGGRISDTPFAAGLRLDPARVEQE